MKNFIWSVIGWAWFLSSVVVSMGAGLLAGVWLHTPIAAVLTAPIAMVGCVYVLGRLEKYIEPYFNSP